LGKTSLGLYEPKIFSETINLNYSAETLLAKGTRVVACFRGHAARIPESTLPSLKACFSLALNLDGHAHAYPLDL
jgi:hypothetical protein